MMHNTIPAYRSIGQFGRLLALGARGRRFKSYYSDHIRSDIIPEVPIEDWGNDGENKVSNSFFGIEKADIEQKCLRSIPHISEW